MYYCNPRHTHAHVLIVHKAYRPVNNPWSHVGLGVNALHTVRVLRQMRIRADAIPAIEAADIAAALSSRPDVTHCVLEALWVSTPNLAKLMNDFPHVRFAVRCHSQVGFLQVEANAVKLFREQLLLQDGSLNLDMSGNNSRFCKWVRGAYRTRCVFLPNLYDLDRTDLQDDNVWTPGRTLKVSSFGAIRLQKNHSTAAAAAMLVARRLGVPLEFHINIERVEHGKGVLQMLRNMFSDLRWAKLVEVPWMTWAQFRHAVADMDLSLQLSATETFNITTADATAEGVPSVVSPAIEWLPSHWQANIDDPEDVARVAVNLLTDPHSSQDGFQALKRYNSSGKEQWYAYLDANDDGRGER